MEKHAGRKGCKRKSDEDKTGSPGGNEEAGLPCLVTKEKSGSPRDA